MDAVAVALTGADAGKVAVPAERGLLGQGDALFLAVLVEQAELDLVATSEKSEKFVPVPS